MCVIKKTPFQIVLKSAKHHLMKGQASALMVSIEVVQALHNKYSLSYQWFFDGTGRMKLSSDEKRKDLLTDHNELQANMYH